MSQLLNCFGLAITQLNGSELNAALKKIENPKEWNRLRLSCYAAESVLDPSYGLIDSLRNFFGDQGVNTAKVAAMLNQKGN